MVVAREQRLAERLLEDEALRGGLDDATWQPIQSWLLRAIARIAASTSGLDAPRAQRALDEGQAALREVVSILGAALSTPTLSPTFATHLRALQAQVRPPLFEPTQAARVRQALAVAAERLRVQAADAAAAATALARALEAAGSPESSGR